MSNSARNIDDVLAEHTPHLMSIPGVTGTAQGEQDGGPCVVIYVVRLDGALRESLPATLDGYPVRIEESGPLGPS